ncbi:MAG: PepSY domain-containing protein, partial [Acidobacteria bacterium]|nr:PepSY domain-containing protein [Acidobacteriota bacterium]
AVVQFRAPGDFHNLGNNEVHLDARTGEVLRVDRWREASFGQKAAACLGPTHAGEFGGTPVKLIWAGLGLILPVLFASGAWMWWKRVLRPKLRRAPLRAQAVGKA